MMAYDQQPEKDYQESSKEMRFAAAVFTAVAAGAVAGELAALSSMAAWDWIILWRGMAIGLVAGGVAYAVALITVTIAPGLPALLLKEVEEATGKDLSKPALPTGQPKRERPRPYIQTLPLAEEPTFGEPERVLEAEPEWQRRVDNMDYGNGRMLINGRMAELPEGFDIEWLYTVAEKRAAGELDTVSLRALDEIGVSRWGNGRSPAAMTIEVLENTGCVQGRGINQPYDWTEGGRKAFPSPTGK